MSGQDKRCVNRKEIARRIADPRRGNYNLGDVEDILKFYEDVVEEALENGEEVKQGKLFKIQMVDLPEKRAYNGLEKTYFIRKPKKKAKFVPLTRVTRLEKRTQLPETGEGESLQDGKTGERGKGRNE
jgi:nucleoid DNA-binding protein